LPHSCHCCTLSRTQKSLRMFLPSLQISERNSKKGTSMRDTEPLLVHFNDARYLGATTNVRCQF
jgi:hypothetical protein